MYNKGPIIDIHCHVGMEKEGIEKRPGCPDWWIGATPESMMMQKARAWIAKNKNAPQAMDMKSVPPLTLEILVEHMDEAGLERAVIIGAKGYMRKSLTGKWKDKGYVWEVPNDYIAECCKKYPDRFIGVIGVDPFNGKKEVDEVKKYYEEYGLTGGIKIFTPGGIAPNNKELCYPLYEKCLEYDIPVHVHTGGEGLAGNRLMHNGVPVTSPLCVDEAAADFPDLRFLLLHAGIMLFADMATGVVISKHNVWIDTSGLIPDPNLMRFRAGRRDLETFQLWQAFIPHRVMFGSEWPMFTFPYTETLSAIDTYKLNPEFLQKFYYENAKEFLGPKNFPKG